MFQEAEAKGAFGLGGGLPQAAPAFGTQPRGDVQRHQALGALAVPILKQCFQFLSGGTALADSKQGIDPQAGVGGFRGMVKPGNAQPAGMAEVGFTERFVPLERTPNLHGPARQVQFPGHHQSIAAIVSRSHHHHGRVTGAVAPHQTPAHRQGRLLHQRLHR